MSSHFYPTRFDVESPERMERTLRIVFDAIYRLGDADLGIKQTALAEVAKLGESLSAPKITTALSAVGPAPLNVEGLLGQLAQPQKAGAPSVSALPDVLLSQDGELVFFDQQLYRFDATTEPGTWTAITVRIVPLEDAVTNAVSTVMTLVHTSTGTVAADFGAGLLYKLEDAAGATQSAGSLDVVWDDAGVTQDAYLSVKLMTAGAAAAEVMKLTAAATTFTGGHVISGGSAANDDITIQGTTHATRTSSYVLLQPSGGLTGVGLTTPLYPFHVRVAADLNMQFRDSAPNFFLNFANDANGVNVPVHLGLLRLGVGRSPTTHMLEVAGNIGFVAGTANLCQLTHAATGVRVWTFPDLTDTIVTLTAIQTLTQKTLTTPTIGDFTNAQHDHSNAAGGGALNSVVAAHTITLAKITAGGADGSLTWTADGRISAFVDPT